MPLPRYLVGAAAVGMALSDRWAPTALSDDVKGVGAGLRSVLPFVRR